MKKRALLILLPALFMQCKEITTTTRVHADGSCDRTVVVNSSSQDPSDSAFPVPGDRSWSISVEKDKKDSSHYIYTATKSFKQVEELNNKESDRKVQRHVSLQRRFRWFSTDLTYNEWYRAYSPYHLVPVSNYLSDSQIKEWLEAPDSVKTFDKQLDEWAMANLLELCYQKLYRAADSLQRTDVVQAMPRHKTALLQALHDDEDQESTAESIIRLCEKVLGVASMAQFKAPVDSILASLNPIIEFTGDVENSDYGNAVIMPGVVIATNANQLEGSEARWTFKAKRFFLQDYHMWVTSRVQNRWAVAVTVVLALLLFAGLVLPTAYRLWAGRNQRTSSL
jgi:hypothetical protein